MGAAVAIVYGATVPLLALLGVPFTAFLFSLFSVFLVVALARRGTTIPVISLILAGAVLGSSFTAATSFVMLVAQEQAAGVLAWLLGSFGLSSWGKLVSVLPFMVVAGVAVMVSSRALNLLQLGDEQAAQLGLPVETFKFALITVATLATAAAVSVSGIIGFVGLMVPHAVRLALGPDHRTLVPTAALLGAVFMVLADLLARTLIAPAEIPIGVITALVGGPLFLYLLKRQRGVGGELTCYQPDVWLRRHACGAEVRPRGQPGRGRGAGRTERGGEVHGHQAADAGFEASGG